MPDFAVNAYARYPKKNSLPVRVNLRFDGDRMHVGARDGFFKKQFVRGRINQYCKPAHRFECHQFLGGVDEQF